VKLTRRGIIASAGAAGLIGAAPVQGRWNGTSPQRAGAPDPLAQRIGLSDLHFTSAAGRSEEGLPVGNGRMGSLVWTTPSQIRLQINRADVYPAGAASNSFLEAHNDFCGGCAFLDLIFDGLPFAGRAYREHLSVHDGVLVIEGEGVSVTIVPVRSHDVFAIAVHDERRSGRGVRAVLRMLRFGPKWPDVRAGEATLRTRSHLAASRLHALEGAVALSQHFSEGTFAANSAVAVRFAEGSCASELLNETSVGLSGPDAAESLLLVGSSASFSASAHNDIERAQAQTDVAAGIGFDALADETRQYWRGFWEEGSISLRSADGAAQDVQRGYHFFLYLMASCSAGSLPPKFNGMLWNTGGDTRAWGAQHWFTNLSCYYEALPASGRFALMDPAFAMYSAMFESCERAARAVWGSEGIFIPETVHFDGVEPLPAAIAEEMRALNLGRKPWDERSGAFKDFAETRHPYSSLWNWKAPGEWHEGRFVEGERGHGPYGPTSHMFAATAKVAYLFWQRYEFTQDREWLRGNAYRMLRGAVEFYRHHPLVAEGADGRIHISGANNSEPVRSVRDTNEDLSAMRGVTAALIRAATILDLDADARRDWTAFQAKLASLPVSSEPDALGHDPARPPSFSAGRGPAAFALPDRLGPDPNSMPTWFFDLCAVEARDDALRTLARSTFKSLLDAHGPHRPGWNGGLSKLPIAAAMLGDQDRVRALIPTQMNARAYEGQPVEDKWVPLRNRLNLGEGAQALSAQHLGRASEALHLALLQSNPPAPGEDPVLHLFPAWPGDWDADYRLRARGGFLVDASIHSGKVAQVALKSLAGAPCRMRNPFGTPVRLVRNGTHAELLTGDILAFSTAAGERIVLREN
jgi:hypothetical protein